MLRPAGKRSPCLLHTLPGSSLPSAAAATPRLAAWRPADACLGRPAVPPPPQGLWQDVFTSWLGGVRDPLLIGDPDVLLRPDQPLLGTLAGGLLPAFFVAPSAAVLTGALEGYWQYFCLMLRDASAK